MKIRERKNVTISFFVDSVAFTNNNFGSGTGKIYLDDVQCSGNEARLIDCVYDSQTSDCSHSRDAGVRCHRKSSTIKNLYLSSLYSITCCSFIYCTIFYSSCDIFQSNCNNFSNIF